MPETIIREQQEESLHIAEKAVDDLEKLKENLYGAFGDDTEVYKNLDESQQKLQEYLTQHPGFTGFKHGGIAENKNEYESGGKTSEWWDEKVSFTEFLFGKSPRKFLTGGTPGKKTLFSAAKTVATKKATADKHENIELSEQEYPGITEKLKQIEEIRGRIEEDEAALALVTGEVKEIAKDKFLDLYSQNGRNPNTFKMRGELGGCIMVIPQDKYIMINAERANEITKEHGSSWIEKKDEFYFNNDMLAKYEEVISDLILNSSQIADEDKGNLIKTKTTYSIKKESIDKIYNNVKTKMKEILTMINPVFQLKNCK